MPCVEGFELGGRHVFVGGFLVLISFFGVWIFGGIWGGGGGFCVQKGVFLWCGGGRVYLASQYLWSLTTRTGAVQLSVTWRLTLPRSQVRAPPVPRLPRTMRSAPCSLAVSIIFLAGLPFLRTVCVLRPGWLVLRSATVLDSSSS